MSVLLHVLILRKALVSNRASVPFSGLSPHDFSSLLDDLVFICSQTLPLLHPFLSPHLNFIHSYRKYYKQWEILSISSTSCTHNGQAAVGSTAVPIAATLSIVKTNQWVNVSLGMAVTLNIYSQCIWQIMHSGRPLAIWISQEINNLCSLFTYEWVASL